MGLDPERFQGVIDEELICPICSWVLLDPVQTISCEHAFCRPCIEEWIRHRSNCPVDRQPTSIDQLGPVPRILRNLLARQLISCDNRQFGCTVFLRLDALQQHLRECDNNPKKPVPCEQGCGAVIPKDKIGEHNCLRDLRKLVDVHEKRLADYDEKFGQQQTLLTSQERDIRFLKDAVSTLSGAVRVLNNNQPIPNLLPSTSSSLSVGDQSMLVDPVINPHDLERWAVSLPEATVTRWGGMISTPDSVLQAVIKRALAEAGCPATFLDELMERAHERQWPSGLESLEVRQLNRRQYDHYVCRRVPGKQAVIILACDNRHMPPTLVAAPGIVMVFAHGVES